MRLDGLAASPARLVFLLAPATTSINELQKEVSIPSGPWGPNAAPLSENAATLTVSSSRRSTNSGDVETIHFSLSSHSKSPLPGATAAFPNNPIGNDINTQRFEPNVVAVNWLEGGSTAKSWGWTSWPSNMPQSANFAYGTMKRRASERERP